MQNLPDEPSLSLRISHFNDILISAATIYNGKTKPSKKSKPWTTPHVRVKISTTNRLRQTMHFKPTSGLKLAVKLPRLSTRPRNRAEKIFKTQCQIQMAQICGKSSKVWTLLLMPTLQTKQCSSTVEPSLTSNSKPTFSFTTMPGLVNLPCREPIEIAYHLRTMKAVLHFKCVSYYLPSKR